MKKSNRLSVRVLALLMTFVMLFSFSATVFAAQGDVVSTKYYTIGYNSDTDVPEIVVTVDAEAFGALIAERNFTKKELANFLPEVVLDVLTTRELPAIGELVELFPEELFTKSELVKVIPTSLLEKYLTEDLIANILPKSEWANILPIKDVIDAEEIAYVMETYPAIAEALITKSLLEELLTADIIASVVTPELAEQLMSDELIDKLVTADVLTALMTADVIDTLIEKLDDDVIESFMNDDALVDKLVTDTVLTALMTSDVIDALVGKIDDATIESFMDDENLVNKLVSNSLIETLITADVAKSIFSSDSVISNLVNSEDNLMKALLDANLFTEDDFIGCLSQEQKDIVAAAPAGQEQDVLFEQLGNSVDSRANVATLIGTKAEAVADVLVDEIGVDEFLALVGGRDAVIEAITMKAIISEIGAATIAKEVGAQKVLDAVGADAVIEVIGMSKIIEAIGIDAIVAELSAKQILDVVGADTVIEVVGMPAIIDTIGLDKIIAELNVSDIMDVVDVDVIISKIGMEAIVNKIGMDKLIDTVLANTDTDYITRIAKKIIDSPSFDFSAVLSKILKSVDTSALKSEVKSILMKALLNDVDSVDLLYHNDADTSASVFAYNSSTNSLELNLQEMSNAILLSIPDSEDLACIGDGDTFFMMGLGLNFADNSNTYGCKVRVELDGDTSVLNHYANRIAEALEYSYDVNNGLSVNVSDFDTETRISFAALLRKALATDALTDSQKAKLFSIFSKEGQDFLDAFAAFDFNASFIDAEYVPYLEQIRDKMMIVLEKAFDKSSVDYRPITFASLYDETLNQFVFADSVSIPTGKLINMVCTKLGFSIDQFNAIIGSYDEYVSYSMTLTLAMDDVYRVRYFDNNGNLLYTTFLPSATDLSVINNNTNALNGKAGEYGWADKNGEIVTVTPNADIDLYPANEVAADTFIATFVADGKVVAKVPFKAGDTKLTYVPRVPEKLGYHGRWENYKLGTENITIKAIYTEKTYTVIYNANGGEGTMANQILTYDKATALSACTFTRDGYTFIGWNTAADGTGTSYADKQVVKNMTIVEGVVLYAQWQAVAPTVHTVTFMANGTVVDKVTFNEGETELSRIPAVPVRAGYVGAWEAFTLTNVDITVNAEYVANEYVVVFNANGGEGAAMPNQTMTYDTFAELSANTYTYAGYVFAGWNTAADGTGTSYADGENVKNLAESGEVTLYAQWNAEVEDTTTATEETTTEAPVDDEKGFNWIVLVIVIAVLAIAGGVAGFLVYKKKKSV